MGHVKVAVHQPNYLPWLGFFHKLSQVDSFVFLDNVQFARRGYSHRVHVLGADGGKLWLTQNIQKRAMEEYMVEDVAFADRHWMDKHLKTLEAVYGKCTYFPEVFPLLKELFRFETNSLSLFNGTLIEAICKGLGLSNRIVYASRLGLGTFSSPSERIACITRHLGGSLYLSGKGARAYNDTAVFAQYGLELAYNDFVEVPYPQRTSEFVRGLSIVDALFNIGFEGVAALLGIGKRNAGIAPSLRREASDVTLGGNNSKLTIDG